MSLTKQFSTNVAKEIEGVEIPYGSNEDGSVPTFVVSRMSKSNKRYTTALERATRPIRRQIELGTVNDDQANNLFMDVFASTVLKGWSNVKLSDVTGNVKDEGFADFSKQNAIALFVKLPELYDALQESSKSASLFRDETLEVEAKN